MSDAKKIMLVDDDQSVIALMKEVLESDGYDFKSSEDGVEAIRICQSSPPDLVILDVQMHYIDGYKACEELKKRDSTKDVPVLLMSGFEIDDDKMKASEADGFLQKPFANNDLLAKVKELMAG